jgi:uncharacterized protein YndB with AHSA1/START domain
MSIEIRETPGSQLGEVVITREVNAPPDLIFEAFMEPKQFVNFWGPDGCHTPVEQVVIEPWAGGRFESVMVADDGSGEYPVKATFLEVDGPTRWSWREEGSGLVSTTTLTDLGNGRSQLVVHQTNVPPMFRTPEALAGFNTALDKLDVYFATR